MESNYTAAYDNIMLGKGNASQLAANLNEPGNLWDEFISVGGGITNTLALGVNAIREFAELPKYIGDITAPLKGQSKIPSIFWWIIETSVMVIIAGLIIRAARGTILTP